MKIKSQEAPTLPPLSETKTEGKQDPGLNPTLKRGIILLTLVTFLAFTAFGALLIKNIFFATKEQKFDLPEISLSVAKRLRASGLKKEAKTELKKLLASVTLDPKTRAEGAFLMAEILASENKCREALVWGYQADLFISEAPFQKDLQSLITQCETTLPIPE